MQKSSLAIGTSITLAMSMAAVHAQVPFLADGATATQFTVNHNGVGQVQLTPYYTVQGSRNTLLNLVNSDEVNGKVLKVRFRGARNADNVLDFYVFLSPSDVWRARIYRDGEQTKVHSTDTSCTWPLNATAADGASFQTTRVFQNLESEVREGYIEILTAADVPPSIGADTNPLFTAIQHVGEATPCTESALDQAMQPLTNKAAATAAGLANPTIGLIGQWAITDVSSLATHSGITTALQAVNDNHRPAAGNIVLAPQSEAVTPSSWHDPAEGNSTLGTADALLLQQNQALYFDFPDLSTPYLGEVSAQDQANQVAAALATTQLVNEYVTEAADLQTDWVLSFPTRRFGIALAYGSTTESTVVVENPNSQYFSAAQVSRAAVFDTPAMLMPIDLHFWNDLGQAQVNTVIVGTPPRPITTRGNVQVLSINRSLNDSLLGAQIAAQSVNAVNGYTRMPSGWGTVRLTAQGSQALTAGDAKGLPAIGFAAVSSAGNAMSFTWPHRYKNEYQ